MCRKLGKTFSELIHKFIIGGDETCFQAYTNKSVVIGSAGRTKHDKKISDSQSSITLYRTGGVDGDIGPTDFVMKGERHREATTNHVYRTLGPWRDQQL